MHNGYKSGAFMREEMLKTYLETMRFLSDTTKEMMYLCDLTTSKIYFADNYAEKLQLSQMEGTVYTLEELQSFLYARNGEKVTFKLSSFEGLDDGLLCQEYHLLDKHGQKYKVHSTERLQYDDVGNPMWIIGHISDIASSKKVDELTKLFNAKKLMEDLADCLEKKKTGHLIILGIDNFKNINNKYGRNFGNHILREMARTLDGLLDLPLRVYRLDSDKFAINAVACSREEVEKLYEKIQKRISNQFTVSSGVASYGADAAEDGNVIYQHAENALDSAKKNGKNRMEFFSKAIHEELLSMIDFREELEKSVANDFAGFSIVYQPQIDMKTCQIYGVEALLRYHSEQKGNVAPDEFIPILEQTKLIVPVGKWVLETALSQCKRWRKSIEELCVSVNLSFVQLRDGAIYDQTVALLEELALPGKVLTLELTESIHLQDYQFFNKIFYKFGKKGVKIAIDDFGTGYSGFGYLKSIAIDEVKIDRSFVSGIQYSAYNYRLLGNLIELAHSTKIRVCCEGVETEAELQTLKELHPDILQGYLFGKPMSVEMLEACYIKSGCDSYKSTRQKEEDFSRLKERKNSEVRESAQNEKMAEIIDRMDEIVYVSDNDTYELMYLNASGREITGMYDYNGRKCYEVLQGRNTPCEFCQRKFVGNDAYHMWEWDNEYLQHHFLVKEKLIQWMGKDAHLAIHIDISENVLNEIRSIEQVRQTEMYNAILSETIAYAEIDLQTGRLLDCGGLWMNYPRIRGNADKNFDEVLTYYTNDLVYPEDVEDYCRFFDFGEMGELTEENRIRKMQFRRNIDGAMQWVELTAHIFNEQCSDNRYALVYLKNIDAEKKQKLQQEEAASRDPLTGVYNRLAFEAEVKRHMEEQMGNNSTLIMLDLDNFKMINDRFGHMEGDIVLKQLAEVLSGVFRKYDIIGRLGGDEFLVFLKDLTDRDTIDRRIRQFREAFAQVNAYHSTCSMGLTTVKKDKFSYNDSLRKADVALYQSKKMGKNVYSYYEDDRS